MVDTSKTSKEDYELNLYVTSAAKIQRLESQIKELEDDKSATHLLTETLFSQILRARTRIKVLETENKELLEAQGML